MTEVISNYENGIDQKLYLRRFKSKIPFLKARFLFCSNILYLSIPRLLLNNFLDLSLFR